MGANGVSLLARMRNNLLSLGRVTLGQRGRPPRPLRMYGELQDCRGLSYRYDRIREDDDR
jgi:hypothetical protein